MKMIVDLFLLLLLLVAPAFSSFGGRESHYGGFADFDGDGGADSSGGGGSHGTTVHGGDLGHSFGFVPSDDLGFSSGGIDDYLVNFDPDLAVGLVFTGSLEVTSISPGSAADVSRVVLGDYLLKVDDVDVDGRSLKEVFGQIREAACRLHGFSAWFRPASSPRGLPQASLEYEVAFASEASLGIELEG